MDIAGLFRRKSRKPRKRSAAKKRSAPSAKPETPKPDVAPPASLARDVSAAEAEAADAAPPVYYGRSDIARLWKVSPPTVDRWFRECEEQYDRDDPANPIKEGGTRGKPYQVDAHLLRAHLDRKDAERQAADAAKRQHEQKMIAELDLEGGEAKGADGLSPEKRRAYYQAEKERMALDLQRGQLIRREDVRATYGALIRFVRARITQWPDDLDRKLGLDPDLVDALEAEIAKLQNDLAQKLMAGEAEDLELET